MAQSSVIPAHIGRQLADKSFDRRMEAGTNLARHVHSLSKDPDFLMKVEAVIKALTADYTSAHTPATRRGGAYGLGCVAVCLHQMNPALLGRFLPILIPPLLMKFKDSDTQVRYAACEAMINICSQASKDILPFFNSIFLAVCDLVCDLDPEVKAAVKDSLNKTLQEVVQNSPSFDVDAFIPHLRSKLQCPDPNVRQLVVGWIQSLDAVPGIEMLDYLPDLLEGLLLILSDKNTNITQVSCRLLLPKARECCHRCCPLANALCLGGVWGFGQFPQANQQRVPRGVPNHREFQPFGGGAGGPQRQ